MEWCVHHGQQEICRIVAEHGLGSCTVAKFWKYQVISIGFHVEDFLTCVVPEYTVCVSIKVIHEHVGFYFSVFCLRNIFNIQLH